MKFRAKIILVKPGDSVKKVMEIIQEGVRKAADAPGRIALVVDKKEKLLGVITDGDIRRSLLAGGSLNDPIAEIYNRHPVTFSCDLEPEEIAAKTVEEIKNRNIANKRLETLVTIDDQGRPYDVFTFFELWRKLEVKTRVISIVGLGYVGLTLGLVLAEAGFKVVGVDRDERLVNNLRRKKSHVHEQGINALLERHLNKNFVIQPSFHKNDSDIYIICVGTPVNASGKVLIEPLREALYYLTNVLKKDDLVILRSTVPVGSCRNLVVPILQEKTKMKAGEDFFVAFAPERTLEGDALNELRNLPQIIGGLNRRSTDLAIKLFKNITNSIVMVENLEAAEMVKLLNNAYRDLTFSFANEVAMTCDKLKLNSHKIIQAANYGYLRSLIPQASPGVGGYCLSKDPYILAASAREAGFKARLPLLAREINGEMIDYTCRKVGEFIRQRRKKKSKVKIFVIGLAFKGDPETADMRNSSALAVARQLKKTYGRICAYDPVIKKREIDEAGLKGVSLADGFKGADCVLILNNHRSYKEMAISDLIKTMKKPALFFDAWHIFDELLTESTDGIFHRGV